MRWNKPKLVIIVSIVIALLFLAQTSNAVSNLQTHSLDTSTIHFKLDNDSRLKFGENTISFGDDDGLWDWLDDDGIRFYNLRMAGSVCPNPWHMTIDNNANMTINQLFESDLFVATISASSGTTNADIYCGSYGEPNRVSGTKTWEYDSLSQICTITFIHSSDAEITLDWSGTGSEFYTYPPKDKDPIKIGPLILPKVNIPPWGYWVIGLSFVLVGVGIILKKPSPTRRRPKGIKTKHKGSKGVKTNNKRAKRKDLKGRSKSTGRFK